MLRRRSLAALRKEVEPVDPATLGRFLPAWQHVHSGSAPTGGGLRGIDGVLAVVEQLAGVGVPASSLEPLVLASRVRDYAPAMLDELTATGEVLWAGRGQLPGSDGWVSLHLADTAALTLPEPAELERSAVHDALLEVLAGGGAYFFGQLVQAVAASDEATVAQALWDLTWAGRLTNDTLAPLRALVGSGHGAHRSAPRTPRARMAGRRAALPRRSGPPTAAGRWAALPGLATDVTRRAHATAEGLLDLHGVVTRGAVAAQGIPGGFAAAYRVLAAFEESGRCRRGYFVAGLGAAQFGAPGAVDRLRSFSREAPGSAPAGEPSALVLAATDPANPYGAALPWPERDGDTATGHRPGRKAGALVVLVDGALVLYVERGGRTLLTFSDDARTLLAATGELAAAVRRGVLGRLTVQRADGEHVLSGPDPLRTAMEQAGFTLTPLGLRLRA